MEKNQFQEEIDKGESTLPPISTNLTSPNPRAPSNKGSVSSTIREVTL